MSAQNVEALLARLLAEPGLRARFLRDPRGEARRAGLSEAEAASFAAMDATELELAGASVDAKRRGRR